MLKILNDLLNATDNGDLTILCLLALSAAFDTLDHGILLTRLSTSFGIRGALLEWFRSYLADRKFTIKLNSVTGKHSQTRGALGLSSWSGFEHYVHIFS